MEDPAGQGGREVQRDGGGEGKGPRTSRVGASPRGGGKDIGKGKVGRKKKDIKLRYWRYWAPAKIRGECSLPKETLSARGRGKDPWQEAKPGEPGGASPW